MKSTAINAQLLRYILLALLLVILLAAGAGFYFTHGQLLAYAKETSELNAKADMSEQNIRSLRQIQTYLDSHKTDVTNAEEIVAESKLYRYQDEIIKDISAMAAQSDIPLQQFDFEDGVSPSAAPATPGAAAAPAAAAASAPGIKSTTVSVTIAGPVNYRKLLSFIQRIEQNRFKMQIASIGLTVDPKSKENVTSDSFKIEVYIK